MAATTEQLVALLGYDPNQHYAQLQAAGVPPQHIAKIQAQNNAKINAAYPPAVTSSGSVAPRAQVSANPSPPGAAPVLNVPYGADYLDPTLQLYAQMLGLASNEKTFGMGLGEDRRQFDLGLGENQRQFNMTFPETQRQFDARLGFDQGMFQTNTLMDAARALAGIYAQGPHSAAELAFLQAGMGFPGIGGSVAAMEGLIGAGTRGATGSTGVNVGGQRVSTPNTLSGSQLKGLQGNQNLAGVLGSFAKAGGNPDLFGRSYAALLPSGFQGTGGGLG